MIGLWGMSLDGIAFSRLTIIELHIHHWINYCGVAFSRLDLLLWGCIFKTGLTIMDCIFTTALAIMGSHFHDGIGYYGVAFS